MTVFEELKQIRKEKGLRLDDVAEKMGCSKQYIHQIESGNASMDKAAELAAIYGYELEVTASLRRK